MNKTRSAMRFYTKEDIQVFDTVRFLYIKTALTGHVFTITLNRPEKRNAFTPTMAQEITFALAYAHYNSDVRCVVINAAGSVFCAGADLKSFHDPDANLLNETLPTIREEARLGEAFSSLLKPSIAQVEGPVLAGGFLLICGCTFLLSTPDASFSLPEVKRGIWPMQVMAVLKPIASERKILEMAITGRTYSAIEAQQIGIVSEIISDDIALEVSNLATLISSNAPLAIQAGMRVLRELDQIPQDQQHSYLKSELDKLLQTADAKEGAQAFLEKRAPDWKGN